MIYVDTAITDNCIIREFDYSIDEIELKWHRDLEDRYIEVVGHTDWKIQLEDELPKNIDRCFIPKLHWHRLIKGTDTLVIKIHTS